MKKTVLFVIGPTACGKSQAALRLAESLKGEIVSADSMQVYRGMDIGTAKPTPAELKKIPHHLIDVVEPSEVFDVGRFRSLAIEALGKITAAQKMPIVAGGSGLYVRALLEGLSGQPGRDETLRAELEARIQSEGSEKLHAELKKKDPEQAVKIKPADAKRIIRALEIIQLSGRMPSDWYQKKEPLEDLGYHPVVLGIMKNRPALYRDIDRRVEKMFEDGLWEEAKGLLKLELSRTAMEAIGYKEALILLKAFPDARFSDLPKKETEKLIPAVAQRTRQFAKRQITWFKREKNTSWFERGEDETDVQIAKRLLQGFESVA